MNRKSLKIELDTSDYVMRMLEEEMDRECAEMDATMERARKARSRASSVVKKAEDERKMPLTRAQPYFMKRPQSSGV